MTTETEGYKGHRVGSTKGKVHKVFDEKGKDAAVKFATKNEIQESTARTWCSTWASGKGAKKAAKKTVKKAAPAKKSAKKAAPKKAAKKAVKRERITEASAAA